MKSQNMKKKYYFSFRNGNSRKIKSVMIPSISATSVNFYLVLFNLPIPAWGMGDGGWW